ncbi:Helix-turn-helix [uncultured archaeon]|nr:Helix-turn-helix [uncultured archaeon]
MTVCEMCGKETEVFSAIIEGSELTVCAACGRFGKMLRKPVMRVVKKQAVEKAPGPVETVVTGFASLIRSAREKAGLTQKDFAMSLNEKESIVQKLENGAFVPPISLAKKLEKLLKIKLVEFEQEDEVSNEKRGSGPLTIGDILNVKK